MIDHACVYEYNGSKYVQSHSASASLTRAVFIETLRFHKMGASFWLMQIRGLANRAVKCL